MPPHRRCNAGAGATSRGQPTCSPDLPTGGEPAGGRKSSVDYAYRFTDADPRSQLDAIGHSNTGAIDDGQSHFSGNCYDSAYRDCHTTVDRHSHVKRNTSRDSIGDVYGYSDGDFRDDRHGYGY